MFDRAIMETDNFLNISLTAKALYFLLGMEADDEGFVSPKRVIRLYGGETGDLKNLVDAELIIPFKSGVVVITDWHTNNYLDSRRAKPTRYQDEKSQLSLIKIDDGKPNFTNDKKYVLNIRLASAQPEEKRREENRIEYISAFESFWEQYPNKKAKKDAFKSWMKLKPTEELVSKILSALESHKKTSQWTKDNGQFVPYPATWLNKGRWEDEVKPEKKLDTITI